MPPRFTRALRRTNRAAHISRESLRRCAPCARRANLSRKLNRPASIIAETNSAASCETSKNFAYCANARRTDRRAHKFRGMASHANNPIQFSSSPHIGQLPLCSSADVRPSSNISSAARILPLISRRVREQINHARHRRRDSSCNESLITVNPSSKRKTSPRIAPVSSAAKPPRPLARQFPKHLPQPTRPAHSSRCAAQPAKVPALARPSGDTNVKRYLPHHGPQFLPRENPPQRQRQT